MLVDRFHTGFISTCRAPFWSLQLTVGFEILKLIKRDYMVSIQMAGDGCSEASDTKTDDYHSRPCGLRSGVVWDGHFWMDLEVDGH